jgi:hypothetical protein
MDEKLYSGLSLTELAEDFEGRLVRALAQDLRYAQERVTELERGLTTLLTKKPSTMIKVDEDQLRCPTCGEDCLTLPTCNEGHIDCQVSWQEVPSHSQDAYWCEDRTGTCQCGANVGVEIDDGYAYLVEV